MYETLNLFNLTGRRALVTGSGRGIGLALARGLAGAGAAVAINDRDEQKALAVAARLRDEGFVADIAVFDVTQAAQVSASVDEFEQRVGAIDILVNNAGIQRRAPLEDFSAADWNDLLRVNLDGAFHVSQAVARHMLLRGRGKIINICSVQSGLGRPNIAAYTASKGAVKMLTKGMAIDWGQHGIQVNGLGPSYFKTELAEALVKDETFSKWLIGRTPSRRWGDVEDLVGAAVFLASSASNFVNGNILYVDGGVTATL
jgi:gluconate 5-dehydrogenase